MVEHLIEYDSVTRVVETGEVEIDSTSDLVEKLINGRTAPQEPGAQLSHTRMKVLVIVIFAVFKFVLVVAFVGGSIE
jgi:hypothetical protein